MFGSPVQLYNWNPPSLSIFAYYHHLGTQTKSDLNFEGIFTVGKYLLKPTQFIQKQIKTSGKAKFSSRLGW